MKRLGDLSELIGGRVTANPELRISGTASVSRAVPGNLTFVTSLKYLQAFIESDASAAVVPRGLPLDDCEKPCIEVNHVEPAFVQLAELFQPPVERPRIGIHPQAIVSPTAIIGDNVCVYPGAVIMDHVEIGDDTVVYPNVTIMEHCVIGSEVKIFPAAVLYENTVVGDRVIIHAGASIGAYGFGYKSSAAGHLLSAQLGNVIVNDDVEIGANTTIDRGTYDSTEIGAGTKIDNLVMIGHNCVIGRHNLLCSQVGIAGSCTTGDFVIMGGQVGLADHLNIGDQVSIGAKSGLMHDVTSGQKLFGSPARPAREEMQILASQAKLPEMRKALKKLTKQVEQLAETPVDSEDTRAA